MNPATAIGGNPRNDLQALTKVIGAVITLFGFLVIGIMLYVGVTADRAALQSDQALIENAVDQSISRILNEQKSVSWWDDTVKYVVNDFDQEWIDINIKLFLLETYGHDELYILSDKNELVYSALPEGVTGVTDRVKQVLPVVDEMRGGESSLLARPDLFGATQGNYNELGGVLDFAKWASHILRVGGQPSIVSAITIAPNVETSLAKGTPYVLVSVVYIDETFVQDIGSSLLIPTLTLTPADAQPDRTHVQALTADDGSTIGAVGWNAKRPGKILLTVILPLVVLGLFGSGYITGITLDRLRKASSELTSREADARHRSRHDALSGFPNRVFFTEVVQRALEAQKAGDGTVVTIAYLDIDRFKDINDTLGHHAGDELIKAVTGRLRKMIDKDDFLARFGGDELAILRISRSRDSSALASLLMSAFTEAFDFIGQNIRVSASIGIVRAPEHGSNVEDLMRNADIALYRAKADGRDRAVSFTEEMGRDVQLRRAIEVDLRGAIERDQLDLYYQPIVSSRTSRIVSVEALLRWRHPEQGDISPARFIPIAEEAGLMPMLGAWVIERAMTDLARWPEVETSINLSPDQFRHTDIADFLAQAAKRHGVDTSRIVLEITESLLLEPSPRVSAALASIRRLGFKIALDDFGTGYSSLTYLRVFHFDKLKIDRSFITESPKAENTRTIVQSIVSLGRSLGMEVIAEGVETEAEFAMMRMFGCSAVQGYYFSKPIPRAACEEMIRKQGELNPAPEQETYGASVVEFGVR